MPRNKINRREENLFDFLRKEAKSALADDLFEGTNLVLCKVLKVFQFDPKGKNRWIDKAFGSNKLGDKKTILFFLSSSTCFFVATRFFLSPRRRPQNSELMLISRLASYLLNFHTIY